MTAEAPSFLDSFQHLISLLPPARDMLDLQAQLDMAFWAKWMFWASIGGIGVSAVAILAAFQSLRASRVALRDGRDAAAAAQRLGEMQIQAYVYAKSAAFGQNDNVVVTCRNVGNTPATNFAVNATAQIVNRGNVSESIAFKPDGFETWPA